MKHYRYFITSVVLPRIEDVLFIGLFVGVIGIGPGLINIDGDLGRHITIGEYILQNREIPTSDLFSHTMLGKSLTPHEWLAQVLFALVHRVDGLDGVVWFCALLISVTFVIVYKNCVERSGMILVAVVFAILAAAAASLHWLARPHLFTILFVVLWVSSLERLRQGYPHKWWHLPLIMLFWVNLHGAFIAGFVIWGIYVIGELIDKIFDREASGMIKRKKSPLPIDLHYLYVGSLSLLATFFNPSGFSLWDTSVGYIRNQYLVSHTAEYLPPNFHDSSTWPFLGLIVIAVVLFGLKHEKLSAVSILMIAGWLAMSLYSVRNVPLYAVVTAPILSELTAKEIQLNTIWRRILRMQSRIMQVERKLRGHLWPLMIVFLVGIALYTGISLDFQGRGNVFLPEVFPVKAVDWLQKKPPTDRMFNYFPWGGYLLYRLWPEQKVFIDGQTDFYGEALTREYEKILNLSEDWEDILDRYEISWILMPADSLVVHHLRNSPKWQLSYEDQTAAILRQR